jgi:hypothetical protein
MRLVIGVGGPLWSYEYGQTLAPILSNRSLGNQAGAICQLSEVRVVCVLHRRNIEYISLTHPFHRILGIYNFLPPSA